MHCLKKSGDPNERARGVPPPQPMCKAAVLDMLLQIQDLLILFIFLIFSYFFFLIDMLLQIQDLLQGPIGMALYEYR